MLPAIAEAVGGAADLLLDGGVRRGTDVVKALALGARRRARRPPGPLGARRRRERGSAAELRIAGGLREAMTLCGAAHSRTSAPDLLA